MNLIEQAKQFAIAAHKGQTRNNGADYFCAHVEKVVELLLENYNGLLGREYLFSPMKDQVIAAAYLHDVVEDTPADISEFPFAVMCMVDNLSRKKGESYFDFIMRIKNANFYRGATIAIKMCDLQHNLSDLNEGSLKDKYRLAFHILAN